MDIRLARIGLKAGAVVLAVGIAAGFASAQNTNGGQAPFRGGRGGPGGPGRGPGGPDGGRGLLGPLPMLASQLDLTDAQKEQVRGITQSHAEEWKALADRERTARQALDTAVD